MSADTTVPCNACKGTGSIVKSERRPPVPLNEKEWLLYQGDLTTSVLVALSPTEVAVARAYTAESDRYNRKKGRSIAQARMRGLLPLYKANDPKLLENLPYTTHYDNGRKPGHVIFEVVEPFMLLDEEERFFKEVILPKFTARPVEAPAPKTETLISIPEHEGNGPVLA